MCQTSNTRLKMTVADHGFTSDAQARRHTPGGPATGERIPARPRMHRGGATIISSRCWTMCREKRYWSPPVSMGDSRAMNPSTPPAPKNHRRSGGEPTHELTSSSSLSSPRRQAMTYAATNAARPSRTVGSQDQSPSPRCADSTTGQPTPGPARPLKEGSVAFERLGEVVELAACAAIPGHAAADQPQQANAPYEGTDAAAHLVDESDQGGGQGKRHADRHKARRGQVDLVVLAVARIGFVDGRVLVRHVVPT